MNASYAWLKQFVDFELTPTELRDLLTMRCATVDEVVPLRADLADIVVGRVDWVDRHPNSDHLWVTRVDDGSGVQKHVVCGAPVVKQGALYPFARAGVTLPGGLTLTERKIRGEKSQGMLCSARELGLGDDHEGILELHVDAAPGTRLLDALPSLGDTRIVIDVSPNRPDLLSHLGVAREIAAAVGSPMHLPAIEGVDAEANEPAAVALDKRSANAGHVAVTVEDAAGCPRYMGVVIRGVRVGPSPAWLAERIASVGGRSINNVVDVTNYLLHELGQPMHAFDLAKLAGPAVVIRRANEGERLRTLDGVERTLASSMTVIADRDRAQAIAGVMGGADSEVSDATTDLFLEVANFDPSSVRRTRRALGLSTDASYRFERGVDVELPPRALRRAVSLIRAVAGGEVDVGAADVYPQPTTPRVLTLRVSRVTRLLGEEVCGADISLLLESIGLRASPREKDTVLDVTVPSWRRDLLREVDLIEEVARLRGYDSFPDDLRPFRPSAVPQSPLYETSRRVREALVAWGLFETHPLPFVKGAEDGYVRVTNPIAENEAYLRRDVLDTLARRAELNLAHMQRNVRLFEIGAAFAPAAGPLPREETRVAALIMGDRRPAHWTEPDVPSYDEWDAKGLAEVMTSTAFPGTRVELEPAEDDVLWRVRVEGTERGVVRRVSLDAPVWAAPAFGVELTLERMSARPIAPAGQTNYAAAASHAFAAPARYRELPTTPASEIDLALLVPNDMPAARVEKVIRESSGQMLERLAVLSEFRGGSVPEGFRSVAWRLTFRHPQRTLESKEIAGRRERLLRTLDGELGVRPRAQ